MTNLIEQLQRQALVWRGNMAKQVVAKQQNLTTGFELLDQHLAGGFSLGVNEIQSVSGIGELRLLLPVLQAACLEHRLIVFIAPNGNICGQMLAKQGIELSQVLIISPETQQEALWAAEQCLRSGACHSVVMWSQAGLAIHQVKRLQIACAAGNSLHFLLREHKAETATLPFNLSLSLIPHQQGLLVKVNKRKCGWPSMPFTLDMSEHWPALTLENESELPIQALADNVVMFRNGKHAQTG